MNIILLSGGSGKRLWPLSNDVRSKQFIKLFKNNDEYESMVQRVYRQITTVDADAKITIATSKSQASAIKNQLGEKASICVEPCRRDTFPAIALAAAYLHDELGVDENEAVVVCPVDPYVDNTYYEAVKTLQKLAAQGGANLTLMGIEPTYPSEKYGYIIPESGENVSKVKEFKEKPDVETAKKYLAQSALWNAGIFAFKLGYLLDKAHSMLTSVPVDIFAAQEIQSDVQENADETITQEIQLSITKQPGNYTQPVDELYSYVPEKDTVFYAKWADSYVITFDAGEGYYSNGADGNSQYSYRLVKKGAALNGVSYNDPYHDEKAFDGWCLTPDCEETIDAYNYVPDKDTTLYAKWANQYTITYDACGGYFWGDESNTTETSKVKEGDTLNSYTPSNADEHKIFDGWYLDPTYEHKIENMYEYKPEKDMTVYAKWADAYKLTYDACGGNFWGSEEPHTYYVKAGDKVEYRYDTPSNGDKTFLGWYLDAEYTQPVGRIYDYVPEKDTTFYAKWEEDTSDEDDTAFVSSQNATDSSSEAIAQEPTEEPTTSDASAIESTEPTATPAPEVTEVPETVVEEDQNTESETPNAAEEETETAEETISEQNVTEQEASAPEAVVTENN